MGGGREKKRRWQVKVGWKKEKKGESTQHCLTFCHQTRGRKGNKLRKKGWGARDTRYIRYILIALDPLDPLFPPTGFANFIDEWSQCDFCFPNVGVILEYLESGITMKKAIFRLSSMWS